MDHLNSGALIILGTKSTPNSEAPLLEQTEMPRNLESLSFQ